MYPFEDSDKSLRRPRGSARPWPLTDALSRSKLPRSRSLINFRRPRKHFEHAFLLELGCLGSILARPEAPRSGFGGQNDMLFERFRNARALAADCAPGQQNIVKTRTRSISEFRTARQKRRKIDPKARSAAFGAPQALGRLAHWEALGASLGWPGEAVLSASGRVPETALGARTDPRSIFRRFFMDFWLHFRRFSSDFSSSIFARAACDEATKSESQKGVT